MIRTAVAAVVWFGLVPTAQAASDWPSYNRTLTSERFASLRTIDASNAQNLVTICVYDTSQFTAFQSGLVQVDGALFATTEHDTIALDPDTCKERWRAHEAFPNGFLGAQRGVAVMDGRVYRGAGDGHVYAYDEKTGTKAWATDIADQALGESVPSAPIAWGGLVFVGSAGGDNKGVKGRMYALDAKTGRIVWETYLVPKVPSDKTRGPQAPSTANTAASWRLTPGSVASGGGTWTSYSLDPSSGTLYVPSGNPAPDFAADMRGGENFFTGSIVALDARSGAYKRHYELSPHDYHDWDASSAPVLLSAKAGEAILVTAPKDGHLYGFDRYTGKRLYRVPLTTMSNVDTPLTRDGVRFCPGSQGGAEWNGPAYDPPHDALIVGQVDWCSTVRLDPSSKIASVSAGQPWTGSSQDGFGTQDDPAKWAGWVVSLDATAGHRRWTFKAPYPVLGAVTPTAGGIVFFGDMGGDFYALNSDTGARLWSKNLGGAVAGGVITYDTGGGQKVAVTSGMTSKIWPTPRVTAKITVLGLR